jgi:L-fuconolactonase
VDLFLNGYIRKTEEIMHIDAEVHFWKYGKSLVSPIIRDNKLMQQDYLPEHISLSFNRNEIDGCIAVAAEPADVETRFLAELAATHPVIKAVVGWVDLYGPKAVEKIEEFQQYLPIRGYRIDIGKDSTPSTEVMDVLKAGQYSLDIAVGADNETGITKWIQAYPDQSFILRDCANPDAKETPSKKWELTIRALAKNQNLTCKVSGLFTNGKGKSWKPADFYPFLEILFDSFGPDRLLYASDWPILLLNGIYVQWKSLLEKFTERMSLDDQYKFFGENAVRLYRL